MVLHAVTDARSLTRMLWLGMYSPHGLSAPYQAGIETQAGLKAQLLARQHGYGYGLLFSKPKWRLIQDSIAYMTGDDLHEIELAIVGRGSLVIVGGDHERYGVSFLFPEMSEHLDSLTLADPDLVGPDVEITVQKYVTTVPARYAVRQPLLLATLEYFYRTGELLRSARWEIGNTGQLAPVPPAKDTSG